MEKKQNSYLQFSLSETQRHKALWILSFWHIVIIAASNYLVQIPFEFFGLKTTWGAFSFPFIFLTTDLTVRIFGASLARSIILWAMLPAFAISYAISILFYEGQFTSFAELSALNTMVARICFASFLAYVVGQLLDVHVFNRLRQRKQWWVAPFASTMLGNIVDTLIFFSVAFYKSSDEYMATHWLDFAWVDYGWKLAISTLLFLPAYGLLLNYLTHKLTNIRPNHHPIASTL
ncbi:MAG: 7-cyano-7-deazaguanine/7-aminomethyl-7-deazaguanine transporter [Cardiobacteriaceae bacterium]|nr:7-cyano-7-deazaguanine/7-aminomethyl-7-deazaguanine transporter [Cardiobacteriaceae bacterium]